MDAARNHLTRRNTEDENNRNATNNNQRRLLLNFPPNHNPVNFGNYEGLFMHYLFINLSMKYVINFKPKTRRLIEFFALLNALLVFFFLAYIHITFVRSSSYCLEEVETIWPRDGILRVQVSTNTSLPRYQMFCSQNSFSPSSLVLESEHKKLNIRYSLPYTLKHLLTLSSNSHLKTPGNFTAYDRKKFAEYSFFLLEDTCPVMSGNFSQMFQSDFYESLKSINVGPKTYKKDFDELNKEFRKYEDGAGQMNTDASDVRDYYAIEFSTEFGYLRLSSDARKRLSIPTLVVNLQADRDSCFGSNPKKWLLKSYLGYDDFIMSSIRKLVEKSNNQGYLRNLITGEYFRFETVWNNQLSFFISFTTMLIFTIVVTMLLRYSYHQIFIAMVEIVRIVDANTQRLILPIGPGPMFTIILALVGMEEIMLEFFHDSSIAFYVILIIWIADQFDLVCMNSVISRRHWIRFFFLYHFAFYAHHHRFNGRFSKIALLSSWLFIQHSMIYFIHHYELPILERQIGLLNNPRNHRPPNRSGATVNNPFPMGTPSTSHQTPPHQNDAQPPQSAVVSSQSEGDPLQSAVDPPQSAVDPQNSSQTQPLKTNDNRNANRFQSTLTNFRDFMAKSLERIKRFKLMLSQTVDTNLYVIVMVTSICLLLFFSTLSSNIVNFKLSRLEVV